MNQTFQQYKDHVIDPAIQQQLNKPLSSEEKLKKEHEDFLKMLIQKLESGIINPFDISTLFNRAVYDKLSEPEKDATDITAHNIAAIIRQIEGLWKLEQKNSFQISNLVETVFQMKSKFEAKHGDVYII